MQNKAPNHSLDIASLIWNIHFCKQAIFLEHFRATFQFHSNLRGVYVRTNLVFVSHKNINSEIAVLKSVYCLTRKDSSDARYSKLF